MHGSCHQLSNVSNIFVLAKLWEDILGMPVVRVLNFHCPQMSSTWQDRAVSKEKGVRETVLAKKRGKPANGSIQVSHQNG